MGNRQDTLIFTNVYVSHIILFVYIYIYFYFNFDIHLFYITFDYNDRVQKMLTNKVQT